MFRALQRRRFIELLVGTSLSLVSLSCFKTTTAQPPQPLRLHPNRRFLIQADGTPFFYLGDTAWELFHRLNRQEATLYLQDRANKGFTVIQAVALAELDGLNSPNPDGERPLHNNDPTQPNDAYFEHVDYIVEQAAALGLVIGMLPTWGDKWNDQWGVGPVVFTPDNAAVYGEYLGQRYRQQPIIWILGGDRSPNQDSHFAIIHAMANGIRKGDQGAHLMTFHPMGGHNSATWFHQEDWLDFNMFQSGHRAPHLPNYATTTENYQRQPVKPTLDGEPRYEDHPINWKPQNGWFDQFDVRQAAYWSMLAGACGHTYGNHNIWQMWQPGRDPISSARTPWKQALAHPGATQMGYLRRLFESRPFTQLQPDQSLLVGENSEGMDHIRAACAEDGSFALVYAPTGKPMVVQLDKIRGQVEAHWFDPRQGTATLIAQFANQGTQEFVPPSQGRGNDWVLVLDRVESQFPSPGTTR